MHALAQLHVVLPAQNIHAETRGDGRERRIGTRKARRHDADGEQYHHQGSHHARCRKHRQQIVRSLRQRHALLLRQHHQQHTQTQKEQIGGHKGETIGAHILLRLTQRLAGKILLHHVLIQSRHHDDHEHAAQKLFPEILLRHPVVEDEDARMTVVGYRLDGFRRRHAQGCHHLIDDEDECGKHAGGLEGIRPHQGLDAALARIEPDEHHHHGHRKPERNAHPVEHEALKQDADHKESHRCPRHLRQEKERGARLVRPFAQPLLQIAVDGGEVIPVVDGEQEETYEEIAHDEAEAHLQIGHISLHHHAGHADEGDARDGGSHHSEGYHIPGRTPVRPIKCFVAAGSPCREVTEHQEHAEVSQNCDNDNHFLLLYLKFRYKGTAF